MIYIDDDVYRLKVCAWAYGWSDDKLWHEIQKMIQKNNGIIVLNKKKKKKKYLKN
jgi:hypothetical protein